MNSDHEPVFLGVIEPADQLAVREEAPALDVQHLFLMARRSAATRRAYVTDFRAFFGADASAAEIAAFLALPAPQIARALETHKIQMLETGASESSINRRMSAIRSLLKFAHRLGAAQTDGRGLVDNERVSAYRNTSGISVANVKKLLKMPQRVYGRKPNAAVRIARDSAILRLLAENGLRRVEVTRLDVEDFVASEKRLMVLGKGRGTQKEPISISARGVRALQEYLDLAGHIEGAFFRNIDRNPKYSGARLTGRALWKIVTNYGNRMGLDLHPHKLRHAAITNMLNANNGNIAAARDFSRHIDPKTLMIYWHNSQDLQGQMTDLLSDLYSDDSDGQND